MYFAETKSFETYHLRVSAIYPVSAATLQHVVGIESLEALSLTALLRNGSSFFFEDKKHVVLDFATVLISAPLEY